MISLLAAGWVILVVGFAIPDPGGAALEASGVIEDNFDVEAITYLALVAGVVLTPPPIAAATMYAEFHDERSLGAWLRLVPVSYPATAMLGISVLQMVAITPILLIQRWRQKRKLLQVPLVMREGTDDDDLTELVRGALASIGLDDVTSPRPPGRRHGRCAPSAMRRGTCSVPSCGASRCAWRSTSLEILAYATTCRSWDRRSRRTESVRPWSASSPSAMPT